MSDNHRRQVDPTSGEPRRVQAHFARHWFGGEDRRRDRHHSSWLTRALAGAGLCVAAVLLLIPVHPAREAALFVALLSLTVVLPLAVFALAILAPWLLGRQPVITPEREGRDRKHPWVWADESGLWVGKVFARHIQWWEIESIDDSQPIWAVCWRRGTFWFDSQQPEHLQVAYALRKVLECRQMGLLLPGEPLPAEYETPDTALSMVRLEGDQPEAARGLSQTDE